MEDLGWHYRRGVAEVTRAAVSIPLAGAALPFPSQSSIPDSAVLSGAKPVCGGSSIPHPPGVQPWQTGIQTKRTKPCWPHDQCYWGHSGYLWLPTNAEDPTGQRCQWTPRRSAHSLSWASFLNIGLSTGCLFLVFPFKTMVKVKFGWCSRKSKISDFGMIEFCFSPVQNKARGRRSGDHVYQAPTFLLSFCSTVPGSWLFLSGCLLV